MKITSWCGLDVLVLSAFFNALKSGSMADLDADELDAEQERKLTAATNAQLALSAVTTERVPSLRAKRDRAVIEAVESGVPAVLLARRMGGKLSAGRISQLVSGNGHG